MSMDGTFAGPPPALFVGGAPIAKIAPAFEMKAVDDTIVRNVATRYEAVHQRVDAIYPLGEFLIGMSFSVV